MFILIERASGERIVSDSAATKFRIEKDKKHFITEGPRNAWAKYDLKKDKVEFTESTETCVKFIRRARMNKKTLIPLQYNRRIENKSGIGM